MTLVTFLLLTKRGTLVVVGVFVCVEEGGRSARPHAWHG